MTSPSEITGLLIRWCAGEEAALESLLPLVEVELHRLAHYYMRRETPGHTLQTTALVNEAFLRLVDQSRVHWQNRAHFFGIAARIMRRILLNYARDRTRIKRGGGAVKVMLSETDAVLQEKSIELLALDYGLTKLAVLHERASRVVELRYFGGLTNDEVAEVLNVSKVTVTRDWEFARAWLAREISGEA